jgi:phage shock protein A
MKKLASIFGLLALGGLFVAGCSYQTQIDQATSQAESSAQRAGTAATNAQNSANQAAQSAKSAQDAATGAQASVGRANDAVARLEAEFASSVTK